MKNINSILIYNFKYFIRWNRKIFIIWNVIGPEGGWSKNEIEKFQNLKMQFIKLSENILRTSTAAINTASVLAECRDEVMRSIYYS